MIDQYLAQRAILEALEGKLEAMRGSGELGADTIVELYFFDDLVQKHKTIFRVATVEDVALAISKVEEKSDGRFKLLSLNPSIADRDVVRVALTHEAGRPLTDISNLYWKLKYKEGSSVTNAPLDSKIFWLTPREIYSTISNAKRSFSFRPGGVQFRLLRWFSEHKGFTGSKELAQELDTTTRTIATDIAKLKRKADDAFGLDESSFIESSQGEGYRLAAAIKIKLDHGTS
ncbi:MAG: helix-turn-helix domain-containing protein [Candidatus Pacebacteria bacterium]|nr:helix-turn-helix domain-containing protein [Candidatus Paceibacterota bacterium]